MKIGFQPVVNFSVIVFFSLIRVLKELCRKCLHSFRKQQRAPNQQTSRVTPVE